MVSKLLGKSDDTVVIAHYKSNIQNIVTNNNIEDMTLNEEK